MMENFHSFDILLIIAVCCNVMMGRGKDKNEAMAMCEANLCRMFLYLIIHFILFDFQMNFLRFLFIRNGRYARACAILRIAKKIEFITFIYCYNWIFNFLIQQSERAQNFFCLFSWFDFAVGIVVRIVFAHHSKQRRWKI